MALLAMIMFGLILTNNVAQYMEQQQEIAHQRASVIVLQMQPHFIYNTMTTIYYLCKQDVDKAQHEDNLIVEYDTPYTRFRIPPLTLQPLVENAVKHSFTPNSDPLHIYVKTRQTNTRCEITV